MSVSNGDAHAVPSAFNGHEMTGITKSKRLNIVSVTIEAIKKYSDLPSNLYIQLKTGAAPHKRMPYQK